MRFAVAEKQINLNLKMFSNVEDMSDVLLILFSSESSLNLHYRGLVYGFKQLQNSSKINIICGGVFKGFSVLLFDPILII